MPTASSRRTRHLKRQMRSKEFVSTAEGAVQKAMRLLLYRPRTEKELYRKLIEEGYTEGHAAGAMEYVASFGYLNDERFAESYVSANASGKGRQLLERELSEKGIAPEIIERALALDEEDEADKVYRLLLKRAGEPHIPDEGETRRLFGYMQRRGFSAGDFIKAMKKYKEQCRGDE